MTTSIEGQNEPFIAAYQPSMKFRFCKSMTRGRIGALRAMTAMSARYDAAAHVTRDQWLCLHRNENIFADTAWPPEERARLLAGIPFSCYPDPECRALRAAIAEMYQVESVNVYVGNGSDEVLSNLLGWLRLRYSEMLTEGVGYRMYPVLALRHGFALESLSNADLGSGPRPTTGGPFLFVVDSPNAITGARYRADVLVRLAGDDSDFLVWDNCYGEFTEDPVPPCSANVAQVRSFSKYYGLAGLRVGYCIASAPVVAALYERKDIFNVNGAAQAAAIEALRHRDAFERARLEMIRARAALIAMLTEAGFAVLPSSGNFVLASHPDFHAGTILAALAQRCIAVRQFTGIGVDNFLRITVPDTSGLDRLGSALRAITMRALA
jgi:histidinol-phosphate aminotransferase